MNSYPIGTRDVFGEGGEEVVRIAVARMKQPGDEKHDRANEGGDASNTGERPAGCSFITSGLPGREFVGGCSLLWPSYASVHHVLLSGFTRASFTMGPVSRIGAKPQGWMFWRYGTIFGLSFGSGHANAGARPVGEVDTERERPLGRTRERDKRGAR